jgi:hypothetical protein
MSLLLPRRRIVRAAIYGFCLLLVLIASDLILVDVRREIRPGFDTTRIISPMLPDGSVDYLMAHDDLYSQGVTPENNAAVPLLLAFGRAALPSNQPTDGITDRIGMPHLPEQGDYYVRYDAFCKAHSADPEDDPFKTSPQLHWPVSFQPITAQWIKANQTPLDLIVQASNRSRYFIPLYGGTRLDTMAETLLPHLGILRDATRALLTRAVLRLAAGDTAGFQDDVLAVHRLARLIGQGTTLIEQLVAWGPLESGACRADRLAASRGKLSAEQLRSLADQITALGEMPSYLGSIDEGERYMGLELMQTIARAQPDRRAKVANLLLNGLHSSNGVPDFLAARIWPIPCEDAMRELNHYYDGLIAAARQRTYARRIASMNLLNDDVAKLRGRNAIVSLLSADWPVVEMMPYLNKCEEQFETTQVERRLTLTALALAAYKADHGDYPAGLGGLPCDSDDLFVDRPLTYSPNDKGYLLYSVGPNMTDDGGKGDDIAVNVP